MRRVAATPQAAAHASAVIHPHRVAILHARSACSPTSSVAERAKIHCDGGTRKVSSSRRIESTPTNGRRASARATRQRKPSGRARTRADRARHRISPCAQRTTATPDTYIAGALGGSSRSERRNSLDKGCGQRYDHDHQRAHSVQVDADDLDDCTMRLSMEPVSKRGAPIWNRRRLLAIGYAQRGE